MKYTEQQKEEIIKKWKPILEKIAPNMSQEKMQSLAEYAEVHQSLVENTQLPDLNNSTFPVSMKVWANTIENSDKKD